MIFARAAVSDTMAEWVEEEFARLDTLFGDGRDRPLVEPTRAFFDVPKGQDEATARAIFDSVAGHLRIDASGVTLIRQPEQFEIPSAHYHEMANPSGTYVHDEDDPIITYDPDIMQTRITFIDLLAHELSHFMLAQHSLDLMADEPLTDLLPTWAGFGVFQLQSRSDMGATGYLAAPTRAYALALFLHRRGEGPTTAERHLDGWSRKQLRRAIRQMERRATSAL